MIRTALIAAAVAALVVPVWAGDEDETKTLTIGDKAPAIDIAHWLKGEQIEDFEEGKVYVLEFWATWCGPCKAAMPHLSEMQEKYRDYDVRFIGVSDEPLQTVVNFLFTTYSDGKVQNDRTHYTLTTDPDESVKTDYFKAAGQRGIPCTFIIGKDRRVEWIGHPMGMDEPLEAVVKDTWDRGEFKAKWERDQANEKIAQEHNRAFMTAMQNGEYEKALTAIDKLIALGEEYEGYKAQKFLILAQNLGDYDAAYAFGHEVVQDNWDDSMMLNQIAWFIVDQAGLERRDFDLALKAAKRANELTDGTDAAILDTVARTYYERGDLETALVYQRKAVKHSEGTGMEAQLREWLDRYEREAKQGKKD